MWRGFTLARAQQVLAHARVARDRLGADLEQVDHRRAVQLELLGLDALGQRRRPIELELQLEALGAQLGRHAVEAQARRRRTATAAARSIAARAACLRAPAAATAARRYRAEARRHDDLRIERVLGAVLVAVAHAAQVAQQPQQQHRRLRQRRVEIQAQAARLEHRRQPVVERTEAHAQQRRCRRALVELDVLDRERHQVELRSWSETGTTCPGSGASRARCPSARGGASAARFGSA